MPIDTLITPARTLCGIEGVSKKRALEILANTIAGDVPAVDADDLFRRLIARERLGSTGIGHGVAIPHCRVSDASETLGALITLKDPVDFDAIDQEPVDVLFAMLVPEEANDQHLQTLAALAGALNDAEFRQQLRHAQSSEQLYQLAVQRLASDP